MFMSPEKQLQKILSTVRVKIKGRFKAVVTRNGVQTSTPWFSNRILDQGLDYLGAMSLSAPSAWPNGPMGYVHIGTGTTPVQDTDTQLSAYLASVVYANSNYYENSGAPSYEATVYQYYTFAQGAVTTPITEVGVSRQLANGQLFSRALITDSFGNATPLEVTAQDQLTLVYALTFVPNTGPVFGTVDLEGNTYNYTAYMTGLTNFAANTGNLRMPVMNNTRPFLGIAAANNGYVQATCCSSGTPLSPTVLTDNVVPAAPAQVDINSTTTNTSYAYTAGSRVGKSTLLLVPGVGNLGGGIQAVMVRFCMTAVDTGFRVLYYFPVPVPKTAMKTMQLGFTATWSR